MVVFMYLEEQYREIPEFQMRRICQENASGWQKAETMYWVNI